jgi:cytoskeletal protein CcmA (bactofilin family)
MFSKSKISPDAKAVPSIISADLTIRGDMMTSGEIQVDGEVFGDIRARAVTVGEHADIQGEIVAESIVVKGKITGRLRGRAVHLTRTARVTGDIWHKTLGVEGGAVVQGQCRHMDEPDGSISNGTIPGTAITSVRASESSNVTPVLVSQNSGASETGNRRPADGAPDLLSNSAAVGD